MRCRRTTRGVEETTRLISQLIQSLDGDNGRAQRVPVINSERMAEIWKQQQKHVQCIQDPPNVQLYTQTGVSKKGGGPLPVYLIVRGDLHLWNVSICTWLGSSQVIIFQCYHHIDLFKSNITS